MRNAIFEYVFAGKRIMLAYESGTVHQSRMSMQRVSLDLLRTSRQIYAETNLLPYRLLTFVLESTWLGVALCALRQLMCTLSIVHGASIQHLELIVARDSLYDRFTVEPKSRDVDPLAMFPGLKTLDLTAHDNFPERSFKLSDRQYRRGVQRRSENLVRGIRSEVAVSFSGFG